MEVVGFETMVDLAGNRRNTENRLVLGRRRTSNGAYRGSLSLCYGMALCAFAGVTDPANDSVAATAINRILALQRLFVVRSPISSRRCSDDQTPSVLVSFLVSFRAGHIPLYCQPAAVRDMLREKIAKTSDCDLSGLQRRIRPKSRRSRRGRIAADSMNSIE